MVPVMEVGMMRSIIIGIPGHEDQPFCRVKERMGTYGIC